MFGLFNKNISSLELCVLFIKVVTPLVENKKEELLNINFIEESVPPLQGTFIGILDSFSISELIAFFKVSTIVFDAFSGNAGR
jgi:hypothetical protein